jgi:heme-degrading monooxygenase HmoA
MIMRVTWGKIRPGKWDEYERLWNDHTAATLLTPGLKARWLLRDTEQPDAGYSLSLWEGSGDFDAATAGANSASHAAMADCFVGQYVTTVTEVRGHHGGDAADMA